MNDTAIKIWHWNALYLLMAASTIIMTLTVGLQPLFLRDVIGITSKNFGMLNVTILIAAEVFSLFLILYLGFLSDHIGRTKIIHYGFLVAAVSAILAPLSVEIGAIVGIGGLGFYLITRVFCFLGMAAVWPQLTTLAGDYSSFEDRPRLIARIFFMAAFGGAILYAILIQIPEHGGLLVLMSLIGVIAFVAARMIKNKLPEVAPRLEAKKVPWLRVREALGSDPRMMLSMLSAFFARSDMILISMFLMLWLMSAAEKSGYKPEEAVAQAGLLLGLIGLVMLPATRVWGRVIVRFGRVTAIAAGMGLSASGFLLFGIMGDPYHSLVFIPAILVGLGQSGCLIAPQVLAMDLTPKDLRGTILSGFYCMSGLGVIFFAKSGGRLFEIVGPHAPFVLIAIGNMLVMTYALSLRSIDTGKEKPKRRKKISFKPVVSVICLMPMIVPLIWLMDKGGITTGMEGLAGLPIGYWNRYLGDWALEFLLLSLALRPLREMSGAAYLARYNRMIGLYASFYVFLHVVTYLWEWDFDWIGMWGDIIARYFILFGIVAAGILAALTVTSAKTWVKKLGGKTWKNLHRSIYAVNILVALHYILATATAHTGYAKTFLYVLLIALLLGYRWRQSLQRKGVIAKPS
jgi:DMSO/TMAO reductase YedYZ heme-binding membrane subunit